MKKHQGRGSALLASALFLLCSARLFAAGTALPKRPDIGRAPALFMAHCSECHDWPRAYETLVEPSVIVPGKPDEVAWQAISQDIMPPTGALSDEDKALILAWIQAGAPRPTSGELAAVPAKAGFLGFESKEAFHRFSGWTSGGVLLAAGIVGAVHAYDMWSVAHAWRDANYPGMDEFSPSFCPGEVAAVYNDPVQQALGWTHLGLVAAGGSFYLANAVTGAEFIGKLPPGWSKARLHRYAFFVHAGLMASEAVMGYFTTQALSKGDHETFHTLLVAHAGVGIAIPLIILGAGTIMDPKLRL